MIPNNSNAYYEVKKKERSPKMPWEQGKVESEDDENEIQSFEEFKEEL